MSPSSQLLATLVEEARQETEARRASMPQHHLERLARALPPPRDFAGSLRAQPPALAVIAEMKRKTPLMGVLSEAYAPPLLAALYAGAGAAAISVLCQETSFGGSPAHLAEARAACSLPIMRKDFVSDPYQVFEARAFGADALLLIVAALPEDLLVELLGLTRRLGMEALVEVHDEAEAEVAVRADAAVIGVNHRDLNSFLVDTSLTGRLRPLIPAGLVLVAESGIHSREEAERMRAAGASAILVGEALMRAPDPAAKLRELSLS